PPAGSIASGIHRGDMSEPALTVQPQICGEPLVTTHPARATVIARQCHGHTLAVTGGADALPQPAVIADQRPDGPCRIKRLTTAQRRHQLAYPVSGGGHKLRQPLSAHR